MTVIRVAVTVLAVMVSAFAVATEPCVILTVRPQVLLMPSDVRMEIRVRRHADHRWLVIEWDSESAGGGASALTLDGEHSQVLYTRWLPQQEPSSYRFVATVLNARSEVLGQSRAEIRTAP